MAGKSTADLLSDLEAAFKGVTDIGTMGDAVLQPAKFDQFVRRMEDRTTVLPNARFISMDANKVDIDRTGFVGRILKSGVDGSAVHRTLAENEFSEPTTATNQLDAIELQAITSIRDRALRRNIEQGGFENTLVDLFGEAAGRDFEEFALLADTTWTHAQDDVLSKADGWIKRAGNRVFGLGPSAQFDVTATATINGVLVPVGIEDMFEAMVASLPKRFIQNISEWKIYTTFEMVNGYRNVLRQRGTDLGDNMQTNGLPGMSAPFKGISVEFCPLLERAANPTAGRMSGRMALLTHPDNMAWGVFHEVTIEREREAKARRTDFVLTFEGDADYEDEDGAVVALVDLDSDLDPTS